MAKTQKTANGSGLNFEAQLWAAADKMRGHMDASEYKTLRSANTNCSNRRVNRDFSLSASNGERVGVRCRIQRNADSFRQDLHPDLKADFILANPPFNMSDWGGENLRQDVRCFSLSASNGERAGVRCRIQRNADSFRADLHPDLKADFILANPPFNMSDWGGENLRQDVRWKFGMPPTNFEAAML